MTTQTYEKMKREIKRDLLRELVLPLLREARDAEGNYREKFIKRVLKAAKEKPIYVYNPKTFLREIK